jgi:hypothetical protein
LCISQLEGYQSGATHILLYAAAAAAAACLPVRFDDLPVAQLPATHDDPRIAAGLEVIRQLDEQLKEAWIKVRAVVVHSDCLCGCV